MKHWYQYNNTGWCKQQFFITTNCNDQWKETRKWKASFKVIITNRLIFNLQIKFSNDFFIVNLEVDQRDAIEMNIKKVDVWRIKSEIRTVTKIKKRKKKRRKDHREEAGQGKNEHRRSEWIVKIESSFCFCIKLF